MISYSYCSLLIVGIDQIDDIWIYDVGSICGPDEVAMVIVSDCLLEYVLLYLRPQPCHIGWVGNPV